jgi:fructose/tagatose bisphosphate aldolase
MELIMSEYTLSEAAQSDRLVQAFMATANDVTNAIIQKARQTKTPVIITDEQGNIVRLDAEELAKRYESDPQSTGP